jgi:uncharacterized membrane protein
MRIIFLIASMIGIIDVTFFGEKMNTNHLIMLCTIIIICYLIYIYDSLEEKINNNNNNNNNNGKSKKNNTDNGK